MLAQIDHGLAARVAQGLCIAVPTLASAIVYKIYAESFRAPRPCSAAWPRCDYFENSRRATYVLSHIGEPVEPPRISPARGPPAREDPPV